MNLSDYVDVLFKLVILAIVMVGLAGCAIFVILLAQPPY